MDKPTHRLLKISLFASLTLILLGGFGAPGDLGAAQGMASPAPLSPDTLDYHDFFETEAALAALDAASAYVERRIIGYSFNYADPYIGQNFPIYALRISADAVDSVEDNYDKNAILFECGMHPREWLSTESCLLLAEHLANNRTNGSTAVPGLLSHADVWIIPISTPAGRYIDDQNGGDPTQFYNIPPWEEGWRSNGDTRLCDMAVNVARNFSRGFNDENATVFCGKEYRGFAPFSSSEANAAREFILNHSISMAVVIHSNAQQIWNQWSSGDMAGVRMIERAARVWRGGWSLPADQTKYDLVRTGVGGGNGQFSAWLSKSSERSNGESSETVSSWGAAGDIPLAGDFDCDGEQDDVVVFHPADRKWYYDYNHNGSLNAMMSAWAYSSDRLFSGDFDRDGCLDDVAAFRPSTLTWYYETDRDGATEETVTGCGMSDYIPIAMDLNSDGFVDDRVAFRPADRLWYVDYSHNCEFADFIPIGPWGNSGDLPIAGDFDRDGYADDLGVFRPSNLIWYYDLSHNGDTDHASGPWGVGSGLPLAGDFNGDDYLDDVGIFDPDEQEWQYDDYHNAAIEQLDEGSLRAIQTIYIELPFTGANYYGGPYQGSPGDGSNSFHPSGDSVADVIADSFIPMAEYLIRQSRAPGCPTSASGSAETLYCPTRDFGLVSAKLVPEGDSYNSRGALYSLTAKRHSWDKIEPARLLLEQDTYKLIYRAQNFSDSTQDFRVSVTVFSLQCSAAGDCVGMSWLNFTTFSSVASQGARNGVFDIPINQNTGEGEYYKITLQVSPSTGGSDDFEDNDKKILKFNTFLNVYLPLVQR